eukprot:contig_16906_g4107
MDHGLCQDARRWHRRRPRCGHGRGAARHRGGGIWSVLCGASPGWWYPRAERGCSDAGRRWPRRRLHNLHCPAGAGWREEAEKEDVHQAQEDQAQEEEGADVRAQILPGVRRWQGPAPPSRVSARVMWRGHLHGCPQGSPLLWKVRSYVRARQGGCCLECLLLHPLRSTLRLARPEIAGEGSKDCTRSGLWTVVEQRLLPIMLPS